MDYAGINRVMKSIRISLMPTFPVSRVSGKQNTSVAVDIYRGEMRPTFGLYDLIKGVKYE